MKPRELNLARSWNGETIELLRRVVLDRIRWLRGRIRQVPKMVLLIVFLASEFYRTSLHSESRSIEFVLFFLPLLCLFFILFDISFSELNEMKWIEMKRIELNWMEFDWIVINYEKIQYIKDKNWFENLKNIFMNLIGWLIDFSIFSFFPNFSHRFLHLIDLFPRILCRAPNPSHRQTSPHEKQFRGYSTRSKRPESPPPYEFHYFHLWQKSVGSIAMFRFFAFSTLPRLSTFSSWWANGFDVISRGSFDSQRTFTPGPLKTRFMWWFQRIRS